MFPGYKFLLGIAIEKRDIESCRLQNDIEDDFILGLQTHALTIIRPETRH